MEPLINNGKKEIRKVKLPDSRHFCVNRKHIRLKGTPLLSKNVNEVQFSSALHSSLHFPQVVNETGAREKCFVSRGQVLLDFRQSGIDETIPNIPKTVTK